jgi:hypothetical protein
MAVSLLHQFARLSKCKKKDGSSRVTFKYYPLSGNSAKLDTANQAVQDVLDRVNAVRTKIQEELNKKSTVKDDPVYSSFSDLNTLYDQLVATLITSIGQNQSQAQATTGANPGITSILQGVELEEALRTENSYILYANIVAAGGTQRDRKNIFSLFVGDFITYSGGVIVNFALLKSKTSELLMADTLRYRTPNTRLHDAHETKYVESTDSQDNIYSLCNDERRRHWPGGSDTASPCPVLDKP